ncbi:PadR family transcriptional regulator [Streptomyces hoynatensis]|uniref:PadR family transcriptional regulator n=1 Tax=Streptomyces hoynatensis TaxID=1141874 RepID=A0A3A9YWP4_9ACTN|nr:PadR family transcriptional regulator [Streptomyces hoynatensis]
MHGFLDVCLLGLLAERRDYGLGLVERLAAAGFEEIPGGTLYPSLLRLEKQGLVRTEREPSSAGPPRKYYELTPAGRAALAERVRGWAAFRDAVDAVTSVGSGAGEAGAS